MRHCSKCNNRHLICDICLESIHPLCAELSTDVYETPMKIAKETGWVCADCRVLCRNKMQQLQSSISRTHEELADMHTLMMQLKCETDTLKSRLPVQLPLSDIIIKTEDKENVDNQKGDKLSHHVTRIIYDMQQVSE